MFCLETQNASDSALVVVVNLAKLIKQNPSTKPFLQNLLQTTFQREMEDSALYKSLMEMRDKIDTKLEGVSSTVSNLKVEFAKHQGKTDTLQEKINEVESTLKEIVLSVNKIEDYISQERGRRFGAERWINVTSSVVIAAVVGYLTSLWKK